MIAVFITKMVIFFIIIVHIVIVVVVVVVVVVIVIVVVVAVVVVVVVVVVIVKPGRIKINPSNYIVTNIEPTDARKISDVIFWYYFIPSHS